MTERFASEWYVEQAGATSPFSVTSVPAPPGELAVRLRAADDDDAAKWHRTVVRVMLLPEPGAPPMGARIRLFERVDPKTGLLHYDGWEPVSD